MRRPRDRRSRFGPNADDVVDFLEQVERLSTAEILALAAAGAALVGDRGPAEPPVAEPDPRLAEARARTRRLAETHDRTSALRAVGDEIAHWATSLAHWFPAGVAAGSEARSEIPPRMAALPVVLDAAYATVMEDLLTEDEADLLCAAWDEIVPDGDEQAVADAAPPPEDPPRQDPPL
jgi:hypothetical protein